MAFIRCPYCQKMLPGAPWGDPTANWGSPYRKCPQCGKECVDITRVEPALTELKLPNVSIRHLINIHFYPYGLIALLCLLGSIRFEPRGLLIVCGITLLGIYAYRVWDARRKAPQLHEKMKKLYAESRIRLQDVVYIRALDALGYKLPQDLLDLAAQAAEEEECTEKDPE